MKHIVAAATLAGIVAGGALTFGQQGGDPFFHHNERGERVHVLPTPGEIRSPFDRTAVFAPPSTRTAVYSASYGRGNLIDHGGLEMSDAGFMAIYWNSSVSNSTATSTSTTAHYTTLASEIDAFVSAFSDGVNYDGSTTDDYNIVQQYGSHASISPGLTNLHFMVDSQRTVSRITDSQIQSYLVSLFNSGKVHPSTNVIYGVYFPSGMRVQMGGGASCSTFCGYHGHFTYAATGMQIKYAAFPYLNCTACKISNLTVADMLTLVTSHEVREAVTDPGDNNVNAWYDSVGYEADDKCVWHNLYQTANGGFWVQPEFSNGGKGTASGFTASYPSLSTGVGGCVVPR